MQIDLVHAAAKTGCGRGSILRGYGVTRAAVSFTADQSPGEGGVRSEPASRAHADESRHRRTGL